MACTRSHVLQRGLSQGNVPSGCGALAFRLCSVDGETRRSRRFLGRLKDTNGKSKTLRKCSFDCRMGKESLNNSENAGKRVFQVQTRAVRLVPKRRFVQLRTPGLSVSHEHGPAVPPRLAWSSHELSKTRLAQTDDAPAESHPIQSLSGGAA